MSVVKIRAFNKYFLPVNKFKERLIHHPATNGACVLWTLVLAYLSWSLLSNNPNFKHPTRKTRHPTPVSFHQESHSGMHAFIIASEPHQLNYQEHIVLAIRTLHFVQSVLITLKLWRRGFIEVRCIAHYFVTFTSSVICGKNNKPFFPPHPTGLHSHRFLTTPDCITYCIKSGQWRERLSTCSS